MSSRLDNFLVFLFLFLSLHLCGQVVITPANEGVISLPPGNLKTLVFKVRNSGNTDLNMTSNLNLPERWQVVNAPKELMVEAGTTKIYLISIIPFKYSLFGKYYLEWDLTDIASKQQVGRSTVEVSLEEFINLRIDATSVPDYILAGEKITTSFILYNEGNSVQFLTLSTKNCKLLKKEDSRFTIQPGESQPVEVLVETSEDINKEARFSFRLDGSNSDGDLLASAYQHLHIFPVKQKEEDQLFRLPGVFSLSYLGRQSPNGGFASGIQGELSVGGKLDRQGKQIAELRLRGPDQFKISGLGQYDEYFGRFRNDKWEISLGDQTFQVSQLSENARFGRGGRVNYFGKGFEVSTFYLKPRFFNELKEESGISFLLGQSKSNYLQYNFLRKLYPDTSSIDISSVVGRWFPWEHTVMNGEYSFGVDFSGKNGHSGLFQFESNPVDFISVFGQILWADKYYPGYFNNTLNINGRVLLRVSKHLDVSVQMQKDDQNIAQDTLYGISPAINRKSAGINYRINNASRINAQFRMMESEDKMPDQRFHIENQSARLNWYYRKSKWQFNVSGEWGQSKDLLEPLENIQSTTIRGSLNGSYFSSRFLQINALFQYSNQDFFLLDGTRQLIYGLSGTAILKKGTELKVNIQNSYLLDEYYRDRDLFYFQVRQRIAKKQFFELNARYALLRRTVDTRDISVLGKYIWQFGIPLEKAEGFQSVTGNIQGISKEAIFYLDGKVAVTDKEGNFKFEQIKPGKHFVIMDRRNLGLHEITDQSMPMEIEVMPEMPTHIEIKVMKGGAITGEVVLVEDFSEKKDIGLSIIEISNGQQVIRQATSKNNRFEFSNLPPGKWAVKFIHPDLDKQFSLKNGNKIIDLEEGKNLSIVIELIPKKRNINFSQFLSVKEKKND